MGTLPPRLRYFPLDKGLYEVAPGLKPLTAQKGNDGRDALVFQIDEDFARFKKNKEACRTERIGKYCTFANYTREVSSRVNRFIVEQLCREHPTLFRTENTPTGHDFFCAPSGERIPLDKDFELLHYGADRAGHLPYATAFDALCSQVQEDIAIQCRDSQHEPSDWLAAIHLCSPSHWSAEDKIGKSFFAIHKPVAGIDKINQAAASWVEIITTKGPFTRFVWGFGTDDRLNHHPEAPAGYDPVEWKGRSFQRQRAGSPFILRVERQVLVPLPEVRASLFTIRISFIDGEDIRRNETERALLRSALLSMTPQSRIYKGLDSSMDEIITWLDEMK